MTPNVYEITGWLEPKRQSTTYKRANDKDMRGIQRSPNQSELIEPLEAAKEPDYG